jgi:hypothetical protein
MSSDTPSGVIEQAEREMEQRRLARLSGSATPRTDVAAYNGHAYLLAEAQAMERELDHARELLRRWHEWARVRGLDAGIQEDTREYLNPTTP